MNGIGFGKSADPISPKRGKANECFPYTRSMGSGYGDICPQQIVVVILGYGGSGIAGHKIADLRQLGLPTEISYNYEIEHRPDRIARE